MGGRTMSARVAAAQAQADAARSRLGKTISELKMRVSPQSLAQDAADSLKDRGLALANDLVEGAKKRPAAVAAIVGAVTLLLARQPLFALLRRTPPHEPNKSSSKSKRKKGPAR